MQGKSFLTFFFFLSIIIGLFQVIAVRLNLYFELPWSDSVIHFLGGIWVASAAFVFYRFAKSDSVVKEKTIYALLLAAALTVGIFWECIELYLGVTFTRTSHYFLNAASDIFFDILGALLASYLIVSWYQRHERI